MDASNRETLIALKARKEGHRVAATLANPPLPAPRRRFFNPKKVLRGLPDAGSHRLSMVQITAWFLIFTITAMLTAINLFAWVASR